MELIKHDVNIDFIKLMKPALLLSLTLIILSIVSVLLHGGVRLGVDFKGGYVAQVKFLGERTDATKIKEALKSSSFGAVDVQQYGTVESNEFLINGGNTTESAKGPSEEMKEALEKVYGTGTVDIRNSEMVGPKVGKDLRKKGTYAVIASIICMFLYVAVRFEYKFATGAVVALVHDVIITIGALSLMNKEFNLTIIAALLTVVGYSVNDTVIIYDRIRETLRKSRKAGLAEIISKACNETLSRTIITSLTTVLSLIGIFFWGGGVIHDFAFAMLVGIVVGTYSSIFVASQLVIYWQEVTGKKVEVNLK